MRKRNIIALVYDFDGTLSPRPMQEYTVIPHLNVSAKKFWAEVKEENERKQGEALITYMMLMLRKANDCHVRITARDLGELASEVEFFEGVTTFFERMNEYVRSRSQNTVALRHYIISSGLKEILDKLPIKKHFHKIFASEYAYNHYGAAEYPKLVVTDTVKTQFLFRINKGLEDISQSINQYMPHRQRPIPFQNMIYIGDGFTDVPCMTVTTKQGGYAIAVYHPRKRKEGLETCRALFQAGRVEFIAPADYKKGGKLETYVKITLETIMQGLRFRDTQTEMVKYYMKGKKQ